MKKKKRIAFQGCRGAYSESAAYYLFGEDIEVVPMNTFEEIYQGIETLSVDGGAIPIENSTAGSIYENYDLLYKWRHPIISEVLLQIEHCLCGNNGASIHSLKRVLSHPQGLAQCSNFFSAHPGIEKVAFYDTAGSAEEVSKRDNITDGAIASTYAAKLYGLSILKTNLENIKGVNFTRFYGIQKNPVGIPYNAEIKSAILFELANDGQAGSLYGALGAFAKREINLTRIESRPHPDKPWGYIFHISFIGSPESPKVIEALEELTRYTTFIYRLGSFAVGKTERLKYED
ncbi:MAG: ACT domain-containing protein [Fibrobacteraceae bacterium]|nr:ACT domain-containing protein [Fibrobacteraceae bacterium]